MKINCPKCGCLLECPDKLANQEVTCYNCGKNFLPNNFKPITLNIFKNKVKKQTNNEIIYPINNNSLNKCPYCKKDVEEGATACPHCHNTFLSTNPEKNAIMYVVSFIVLFFILYLIISGITSCEAKRSMAEIESQINEINNHQRF